MKPLLRVRLCVEGIAPHRALDKLARQGVRLYDVQKTGVARLNFEVRAKDAKKVFAIFSRSCYTVTKTGISRGLCALSAVRRRPGFVCGALFALLLSFAADTLVLRIDVSGSAARYAERAEQVLAEAGIGVFSLYGQEAADTARAGLLAAFPDVAFAEVEKRGCVVYVTLEEGDVAQIPARTDVLSAPIAATVEELTVLRGQAQVEEGQQVSAGETLVLGRIAGTDGTYTETFVSARCVLRGEYVYTAAGSGEEDTKKAVAAAALEAERTLLQGDVQTLTVVQSRTEERGGGITVTLTLRLVLAAAY